MGSTKNTKATANTNTKEAKNMKKETTKKATVKAPETKVETKTAETTKAPATEKAPKENRAKINLTIQDVEKMLTEAHVGFKPNKCEYRILLSGSSLHVKKSAFVFYTTDEDFKKVSSVKADDLELKEQGNAQDGKRPNYVRFTTEDTLKKVISALSVQVAVA